MSSTGDTDTSLYRSGIYIMYVIAPFFLFFFCLGFFFLSSWLPNESIRLPLNFVRYIRWIYSVTCRGCRLIVNWYNADVDDGPCHFHWYSNMKSDIWVIWLVVEGEGEGECGKPLLSLDSTWKNYRKVRWKREKGNM